MKLAFILGLASYALAAQEYTYSCRDGLLPRSDSSSPIVFQDLPIGTSELEEDAADGTTHHVSMGHHFCQKDWYLTPQNVSWTRRSGFLDNKRKMILVPSTSHARNLQKRGPVMDFFSGALSGFLNLVCCSSATESGLASVSDIFSSVSFVDELAAELQGQTVDSVVGTFSSSGASLASTVVPPQIDVQIPSGSISSIEVFLD